MDFVDGLPMSNGKTTILVVVDRLSKYAHFLSLSHPYTATGVARIFFDNIFKLHGMPRTIVCDRDSAFTSLFWIELFKLNGTNFNYSSAYHPQTDGQSEVVNRTMEMYLGCFSSSQPKEWSKWLAWLSIAIIPVGIQLLKQPLLKLCMVGHHQLYCPTFPA